tara:strand:+ start:710 stop:1081 length:372 start_codon:yes stop_codon:yes gene_type:complete
LIALNLIIVNLHTTKETTMNHENPWDLALPLITSNGEADKLNTTTIEILNRLSDRANPNTGFAITRPDELARDAKRPIEEIRKELTELVKAEIIKPVVTIEQGLFMVHPRLMSLAHFSMQQGA